MADPITVAYAAAVGLVLGILLTVAATLDQSTRRFNTRYKWEGDGHPIRLWKNYPQYLNHRISWRDAALETVKISGAAAGLAAALWVWIIGFLQFV